MRKIVALCAWLALLSPCMAQTQTGCLNTSPCFQTNTYTPQAGTTLPVSNVSANTAFPASGSTLILKVTNTGSVTAFVAMGNANVVATTQGLPLQPGQSYAFIQGLNTNIAAITASGTASLDIQSGTGVPVLVSGSVSLAPGTTIIATPLVPTMGYSGTNTASVGTTSALLFAPGTYTRTVTVQTLLSSTTNVWLRANGTAAVAGTGILVRAGGGSFTFGGPDAPLPTGAVNAITDGGTAQTVILFGG